jgi:phthalate 4,5-dioxygenase oxygenase subunit
MVAGRTYTGLIGTTMQDIAVQESMGPIQDRSIEHLGLTDKAIVHMRRMLLSMARSVRDGNELDLPALMCDYGKVRSAAAVIPRGADWWTNLYGAAESAEMAKA